LTAGEVFKDEILAGTESTNNPTNEMPEPHDHGKNLNETPPPELISKSLILRMYGVLMTHRCPGNSANDSRLRNNPHDPEGARSMDGRR